MKSPTQKMQVVLGTNEGTAEVAVPLDAFFEFNHEMNSALRELETKWQTAIPRGPGLRSTMPTNPTQ